MHQAVQTLPPGYQPGGTLDLAKNKVALIGLNIAGLGSFFLFGWVSLRITLALRPDLTSFSVGGNGILWLALGLLAITVVQVVVHELIHGLFFWLFTRERPRFGFKGAYAYAAAPDWYLPRNQHMVVGLAPLVVITLLGFLFVSIVPGWAIPGLLFAIVSNAAGAVGDIAVVTWLLFQPRATLVRDVGDAITLYHT